MHHSTLYWHCASHVNTFNNEYRPPHEHKLIACAGIEVKGDSAESATVTVWAILSPNPITPLNATLNRINDHSKLVTLYGTVYGLPVLWNTALKHGIPMPALIDNKHVDLGVKIGQRIAPNKGTNFDTMLEILGLPPRQELDVIAAWESGDRVQQQEIPKRLVADCCCVALAHLRLSLVDGTCTANDVDILKQKILVAASEKIPTIGKLFANEMDDSDSNVEDEDELEEEEEEEEEEDPVTELNFESEELSDDDLENLEDGDSGFEDDEDGNEEGNEDSVADLPDAYDDGDWDDV
jgi:hypothetical protein